MKKKIVTLALLGATTSLMALGGEFAYLYKDPRIMGMGGTNVAVGAYSTSVFSNPAGLTDIKKEDGFVVDILSVGLSATAQTLDFANDLNGANKVEDVIKVLEKYNGEHFHYSVDNYTAVSKNSDAFAWSVGLLAATDANLQPHTNDSNGIIASSSRGYGGIVLGAAKPFDTDYGRIDIGVGAKFIMQQSYEGTLSASDVANSNDMLELVDKLRAKYEKQSSGFGVDLGVTYHPLPNNFWHPALGMSVMNIGSMSMDNNYGGQPTTVNFGASITPDVSFMNKLVIAADYVDAFNANTIRQYTYDSSGDVTWKDYTDSDVMKRVRLGVGLGLIDSTFFSTALNLGMYQSAYTAGLNMELSLFKLNLATYQEEIGTLDTTIEDRRYMAQLGFGW